jgi:hypothetical protein
MATPVLPIFTSWTSVSSRAGFVLNNLLMRRLRVARLDIAQH